MNKIAILLGLVVACLGQNVPQSSPPPLLCGVLPSYIYRCLGNPKLVKPEAGSECRKSISECERMKCIFRKSGWYKDDKLEYETMRNYFTTYAKEHPEWSAATDSVKKSCLTPDLQPQGVYVDCPAYDIVHCAITAFFRNAKPEQWGSGSDCEHARAFAAACPVCPEDCFAPAIPIGSCNACRLLPISP